MGGVYLDTDVLLHKGLDELLEYDCWLASDDVRYIATGLGFGAVRGCPLIEAMMKAYETYEYPSGTNVIRDTQVAEKKLIGWKKSDQNTTIGNVLIIGLRGYGEFARHLYTYTWADEATQQKRLEELKEDKRSSRKVRILWKIKCFARNPAFIQFFDQRRGSAAERLYSFLAYDLLDYGLRHFAKRILGKIFVKKK